MTDTASGDAPYGRFAEVYDALLGDQSFQDMQKTFEWIRNRYSLQFASAADIGCGTGSFVDYLCRTGSGPVWGVDLSPQMLEVAAVKNVGPNYNHGKKLGISKQESESVQGQPPQGNAKVGSVRRSPFADVDLELPGRDLHPRPGRARPIEVLRSECLSHYFVS